MSRSTRSIAPSWRLPDRLAGRGPDRSGRRPGPACPGRDAGQFEGPRVDPGRVAVATGRKTGRSGTTRSRSSRRGYAAGEVGHRPAAAADPGLVGMRGRVGRDRPRGRRRCPRVAVQVAAQLVEPGVHRVDVRVAETRDATVPSAALDDPGTRAADGPSIAASVADRDDPPVANRQGLAQLRAGSIVATRAPRMTRSAGRSTVMRRRIARCPSRVPAADPARATRARLRPSRALRSAA